MTFSLVLFWVFFGGLYFVIQLYSSKSVLIPAGYSNVIVINPSPLLEQSTHRLLTDEKYQSLYKSLKSKLLKIASGKEPNLIKLGIDLTAPIVFAQNSGGEMVLIFQLNSQLHFTNFCRKLNLKNQSTKNQGIIFLGDKTTQTPITFREINLDNHSIFVVYHRNHQGNESVYDGRQLSFSTVLSQIPVSEELHFVPHQRGIRVVAPISKKWLKNVQMEFLIPFVHMTQQVAIDYQGIAIRNKTVVPLINSVIQVPDSIDRNKFENLIGHNERFQIQPINTFTSLLHYGNTTLFLKELGHHEYFIGVDTSSIERNHLKIIYEISGKLNLLTKIEGSIMVKATANMIPGFQSTRLFAEKLEPISIMLKRKSRSEDVLELKIGIKDNGDFVLECINYLLTLQEELE